ncbi:MAG: hypothetical protein HYZ20_09925 [Burkholderiales bacterium]|nr:hypothetical protein [Burkholderiales bacterium]
MRLNAGRTDDCGLRLSLPPVAFGAPTLGDLQGLEDAEAIVRDVADLVLNVVSIVRSELPVFVNRLLDPALGPQLPPPPSPLPGPFPRPPMLPLPFPFIPMPGPTQARILFEIGRVVGRIAALPPRIASTPPVPPAVLFPPVVHIAIGVDRDLDVGLRLYSRMSSTYSFGVGRGTSYILDAPVATPAVRMGIDRPWFAKALLSEGVVPQPTSFGVPFPMPLAGGILISQLGVAGATTAVHGGLAQLRSLAHGLDIPVRLNGNYGRLRIVVEPKAPCRVLVGDLSFEGPTEDDLAAQEAGRSAAVQGRRDAMLTTLSDLQGTLGVLGSAAGAVPIAGALIDTALQSLVIAIEGRKQAMARAIDGANQAQQRLNLTLAETFPERGPVGLPEDDPRP